ncbi:MAG: hypothetical protein K6U80_19605 [Firmicutes bacterium]|nr:hypothetical protein [Bacillota bacterium]
MRRIFLIATLITFLFTSPPLNSKTKLQLMHSFPSSKNISFMSLDVKSESPVVTLFDENEEPIRSNVYLLKRNSLELKFSDVRTGTFSPDGNYYTYVKNKELFCIFSKSGKSIKQIPIKGIVDNVSWSYDSKYVYFSTLKNEYLIHRFNVKSGEYEIILKSYKTYYHPVTVMDVNILYFLESKDPEGVEIDDCNIVRYYLKEKRFEKVRLPEIDKLWIANSFSVSPDNKYLIFEDFRTGLIHVVDLTTNKVIDSLSIPADIDTSIGFYCWKPDSSYVLFTVTLKEIYKYSFK